MSFALTKEQIKDRTKTVTRRTGWKFLKPGDRLRAVEKAMGLKKGEKVKQLAVIEVVSARREMLAEMVRKQIYGYDECKREGFPMWAPEQFSAMFLESNGRPDPCLEVTRIEFKYVS